MDNPINLVTYLENISKAKQKSKKTFGKRVLTKALNIIIALIMIFIWIILEEYTVVTSTVLSTVFIMAYLVIILCISIISDKNSYSYMAEALFPGAMLEKGSMINTKEFEASIITGNLVNGVWKINDTGLKEYVFKYDILNTMLGIKYFMRNGAEFIIHDVIITNLDMDMVHPMWSSNENNITFNGILITVQNIKNSKYERLLKEICAYSLAKRNGALVRYKETNHFYTNVFKIKDGTKKIMMFIPDVHIIANAVKDKKGNIAKDLSKLDSPNNIAGVTVCNEAYTLVDVILNT